MVIKVKVSDVAKDFGKSNKEIIDLLGDYCGGPAKKASTVLEENELNILFDKITQQNSVKSLKEYFEAGEAKRKQTKQNETQDKAPGEQKKQTEKQQKKPVTAKDKKRQSQAAILQMAQQAAKRAEEKAKKKAAQQPQARTKGETRHVHTRENSVLLGIYNL